MAAVNSEMPHISVIFGFADKPNFPFAFAARMCKCALPKYDKNRKRKNPAEQPHPTTQTAKTKKRSATLLHSYENFYFRIFIKPEKSPNIPIF